jgi:glycosyltransferase involved in cell wall biosynthesis
MQSLSVIIPAYNEESGIAQVLDRVLSIRATLQACGIEGPEVVVVDDGSRDRTAEIVGRYARNAGVRLVRHSANRGYGAALKTGFRHATGSLLAFLDADGTYPPECLPDLCRAALGGAELVIGSRMAGVASEMPAVRRLGNRFFAAVVSLVSSQRVTDSASGMRVFQHAVLERLYPLPDGLNFTPVMSTRAIHESVRIVEVPIPYRERLGQSKLSVVRDGLRFLNSIMWTALTYNPVRILGALGLLGVGFAVLVFAVLAGLRLAGVTDLSAWGVFAVYAALVLGVTGVSLFSLGTLFNYLVSLARRRPVRQGLFGKPIFATPLDRQFWWLGGLAIVLGLGAGVVSLALGLGGWPIERLWLWLLGSALLILMGVQLAVSWLVMRVLEELSQQAQAAADDFGIDD